MERWIELKHSYSLPCLRVWKWTTTGRVPSLDRTETKWVRFEREHRNLLLCTDILKCDDQALPLSICIYDEKIEKTDRETHNVKTIPNHTRTDTIVNILNKYNLNCTKTILLKEIGIQHSKEEEEEEEDDKEDSYSDEHFEDNEDDGFSTPPDEIDSSMEVGNINDLTKQEEDLSSFLSEDAPTSDSPILREEVLEATPSRLSSYDHVINIT